MSGYGLPPGSTTVRKREKKKAGQVRLAALARVWSVFRLRITQRENLPQQDSVGPDVTLTAVKVLENALWGHPLNRQEGLENEVASGIRKWPSGL